MSDEAKCGAVFSHINGHPIACEEPPGHAGDHVFRLPTVTMGPSPEMFRRVTEERDAARASEKALREALEGVLEELDDMNGWRPTALSPGGVAYESARVALAKQP